MEVICYTGLIIPFYETVGTENIFPSRFFVVCCIGKKHSALIAAVSGKNCFSGTLLQ